MSAAAPSETLVAQQPGAHKLVILSLFLHPLFTYANGAEEFSHLFAWIAQISDF
jgi:hypothetical protein